MTGADLRARQQYRPGRVQADRRAPCSPSPRRCLRCASRRQPATGTAGKHCARAILAQRAGRPGGRRRTGRDQQALIDQQLLRDKADGIAGPATRLRSATSRESAGLPASRQESFSPRARSIVALVKAPPTRPIAIKPPDAAAATHLGRHRQVDRRPNLRTPQSPREQPSPPQTESAKSAATVERPARHRRRTRCRAIQKLLIDHQAAEGRAHR